MSSADHDTETIPGLVGQLEKASKDSNMTTVQRLFLRLQRLWTQCAPDMCQPFYPALIHIVTRLVDGSPASNGMMESFALMLNGQQERLLKNTTETRKVFDLPNMETVIQTIASLCARGTLPALDAARLFTRRCVRHASPDDARLNLDLTAREATTNREWCTPLTALVEPLYSLLLARLGTEDAVLSAALDLIGEVLRREAVAQLDAAATGEPSAPWRYDTLTRETSLRWQLLDRILGEVCRGAVPCSRLGSMRLVLTMLQTNDGQRFSSPMRKVLFPPALVRVLLDHSASTLQPASNLLLREPPSKKQYKKGTPQERVVLALLAWRKICLIVPDLLASCSLADMMAWLPDLVAVAPLDGIEDYLIHVYKCALTIDGFFDQPRAWELIQHALTRVSQQLVSPGTIVLLLVEYALWTSLDPASVIHRTNAVELVLRLLQLEHYSSLAPETLNALFDDLPFKTEPGEAVFRSSSVGRF